MPANWFSIRNLLTTLFSFSNSESKQIDKASLIPHGFEYIESTNPSDVFVVGYPKSGNTWVQNLIAGLLFGIDTRYLSDRLTQLLVPNVHGCDVYKRLLDFTCFKTHELPRPEYRRVIYLVRDGRDAMVSYYHMLNAVSESQICFQEMLIDGKGLFPCKWHEHIDQWLENPFNAEMMILRYEDLKTNPFDELKRICTFLGIDRDETTIRTCIDGNEFSAMQTKENQFGWDNQSWKPADKFIRRGIVGSHKDEMPESLRVLFEEESRSQLLEFGYDVPNVGVRVSWAETTF